MGVTSAPENSTDPEYEELCEWRDLWLSRLMFGFMVGPEFTERRSFNDFLLEHAPHLAVGESL